MCFMQTNTVRPYILEFSCGFVNHLLFISPQIFTVISIIFTLILQKNRDIIIL